MSRKSITTNSIYNLFYKFVSVLYPLVAVSYVSHILMSDRIGMISYAQNIVSYFVVFAALGLPTYGVREIAKVSRDPQKLTINFWEFFTINAVSTSISLIVYIILLVTIPRFNKNIPLYFIAGLQILLNYLSIDWLFQGMEEYRYISIRSTIVKLASLILLFVMVRSRDDYLNYAFIYCLGIAGNNIFNIIRASKYVGKYKISKDISRHFKPIIILLVASIAVELFVMVDTTMLGLYCDDSSVGCYSNAMKLVRTVNTSIAAIGAVLLPRLSTVYEEKNFKEFNKLVNSGLKIMLLFAFPAALGLVVLSKECVLLLFGDSFINAISILKVLALMIPFVVCNTILGAQVLITANREKKYMLSVMVSALVNIVLNALLIPKYGAPSAAIASLISEVIVLVFYVYFSKDIIKVEFEWHFVLSISISLGLYYLVSKFVISQFSLKAFSNFVVNIVACCVIYFGVGYVLKNQAIHFCYGKFHDMINRKFLNGSNSKDG